MENLQKIKTNSSEIKKTSYVHLGGTFSHSNLRFVENSKRKVKRVKSERLKIRYQTRDRLVEHLSRLGEVEKASNIGKCGEKFEVLTCGEHIVAKNSYHRCDVRFCPMCAGRRSNKYKSKYLPYASDFVKLSPIKLTPCLLTLTQKKIVGEDLSDSRERLLISFRKLIRRKFFGEYFAGGIFAIENTFSDDGNHCHIHCVVFRKTFIDADFLKNEWASVSEGAKNLNIKRIENGLESGLGECLKYISKPLPADKLRRSHVKQLLGLAGKRMLDTFGEFRLFCRNHELPEENKNQGTALTEGQCCPNCNDIDNLLFTLTMSKEEYISFYERLELTRGSPPINN